MSAWSIPPHHSLIEAIVSHLCCREKDYSSNLVVFPGKRPSHFLRKALAARERSAFIPPRIFSMDEFIDTLYESCWNPVRRKIESIDAVAILHDIHNAAPESFGQSNSISADAFFPIGLMLYHDLEELCIECIDPGRVKEVDVATSETIPQPTAKKLRSLSFCYTAFYQRLDQAGYSTRSSRYRDVALNLEKTDLDAFNKIIFAGFCALTSAEKKIFNFLTKREGVVFLFQDGARPDIALPIIRPEGKGAGKKPAIHFFKSPDTHGQVLGLANILNQMTTRGEPLDETTVIVLPSAETLFPLYHHALNLLASDRYNISLGYPLQRTPLFSLFNTLMQLILSMEEDRIYVPHYLAFILHPYIKNIYYNHRAETTRILVHTIEEALIEGHAKKFVSLTEIENNETMIKRIQEKIIAAEPDITPESIQTHVQSIHHHTIRKMSTCENIGDFATKLKEVITFIYDRSTARLHPFFYPYAESFVTQLDALSRSLMKEWKFQSTRSYFILVKKLISNTYTPFTGTPLQGVQVLGFLETRNIQFKKVFFLDANEGIIPETAYRHTLLPFKVRQMLQLPTHLDRERLAAHHFDTLIRGAEEVYLWYVENTEQERSRFVEKLLWERQKEDMQADDRRYVKTVQYAVTLQDKKPQSIRKTDEVARFLRHYPFSATALNTYLACPLKFYYEYVLALRAKEMVSDELEREEIGLFVHQVLCEYFTKKTERPLSVQDMNVRELEAIIQRRFDAHYGRDAAGELYLMKRQIEKHLKDFIQNYQIPKIKGTSIRITQVEQRIQVVKDSFSLTAVLDRIEQRNGRTTIIDYKISAHTHRFAINFKKLVPARRESWSEAIPTLQLPFYMMVYAQHTGISPNDMDCLFLLLGRHVIDASIELPLFQDREECRQQCDALTHVIFSLLREIVDPSKPFAPAADPHKHCMQCTYKYLCG